MRRQLKGGWVDCSFRRLEPQPGGIDSVWIVLMLLI